MFGLGYVGLVTGTCFAELGNDVIGFDVDRGKIATLELGRVPIYEPGLAEMIERNIRGKRLRFTRDVAEAVRASDLIFIAVGTKTRVYRSAAPDDFGIYDDSHLVGILPAGAPEVVQVGASWYIASVRADYQGIEMAKLTWAPGP